MVDINKVNASPDAEGPAPGRHRLRKGRTLRSGRVVGATPAQFVAENIVRSNDRDMQPVTRRAR